jgi:hypothetical protein
MFSASKSGQYQGYQISRSVRLRSSASAYFNRTFGSPTSQNIWTYSAWIKRGALAAFANIGPSTADANNNQILFNNDDTFGVILAGTTFIKTTQVFRDPSAWYHIILNVNSGASGTNKMALYINGVQVTAFSTDARSTFSSSTINTAIGHNIGRYASSAANYFDGYLTEINFIDGQALTPSSFGAYNAYGVWSPMKYNGTYGTNGFYLNFSDPSAATAAAIGADRSGNGNNWTPNNISVTAGATYDSMLDVPTPWPDGGNGRGNYAVLNPLYYGRLGASNTFSNGNLQNDSNRTGGDNWSASSITLPTSGKWYCEVIATGGSTVGVVSANTPMQNSSPTVVRGYYGISGEKATPFAAYGATYTNTDVIGIAADMDSGTLTFYKNGTSQGTAFSDLISSGVTWCFGAWYVGNPTNTTIWNFGQRPFSYTPPTGFRALNTQNLPTPTIANGALYMAATLYTGNGSTQSINNAVNGVSFQPDLVWLKARSIAESHELHDAVRGASNLLKSNSTAAEVNATNTLTSFNSNGFSLGSSTEINTNAATYVGWQWKEGATQGFDIVTYTGDGTSNRQISHSLGVTPAMIIVKVRSTTNNWRVWHQRLTGSTYYLGLNQTAAEATSSTVFNGQSSTTFTVGNDPSVNVNAGTFVAYLFSEVAGFSRFGSYTGNGSTDGPFVFTGFRPRWVMVKASSGAAGWAIYDSARNTSNATTNMLFANTADSEFTSGVDIDILSNGFKMRSANGNSNGSGVTFIFAAFAENPTKYALAR